MTDNEALKIMENLQIDPKCNLIETLDFKATVIKALEKQVPKKPDYEADGYSDGKLVYDYAKCPICGHDFEYGINDWEAEYCSDCGQKLDWE